MCQPSSNNVGLMLTQRQRRWPSINTALCERLDRYRWESVPFVSNVGSMLKQLCANAYIIHWMSVFTMRLSWLLLLCWSLAKTTRTILDIFILYPVCFVNEWICEWMKEDTIESMNRCGNSSINRIDELINYQMNDTVFGTGPPPNFKQRQNLPGKLTMTNYLLLFCHKMLIGWFISINSLKLWYFVLSGTCTCQRINHCSSFLGVLSS